MKREVDHDCESAYDAHDKKVKRATRVVQYGHIIFLSTRTNEVGTEYARKEVERKENSRNEGQKSASIDAA